MNLLLMIVNLFEESNIQIPFINYYDIYKNILEKHLDIENKSKTLHTYYMYQNINTFKIFFDYKIIL